MKKLLLMLLLWSAGVQAQLIIGGDTIATRKWVRDNIGTVVPGLGDCIKGPTLQKVSNVSSTYLNFLFDGEKVEGIDWIINDINGNQQRSGNVRPANNTPGITFNSLQKGTYYLVVTGSTCKSKISSMQFVVPGESGGITPTDPIEDVAIPKFTQSPKALIHITNANGAYTDDLQSEEYIDSKDGLRYRVENGITYRVLYWITELPLVDESGNPVDFGTRYFPNGIIPSIRKEYVAYRWTDDTELRGAQQPFIGAINQDEFKKSGWLFWLHNSENPDAKSAYLWRTVMTNFTTNGGRDLETADWVTRDNNASWLDASNLVPQFMEHPSPYKTDKAVSIQNWPNYSDPYETTKRLVDGGVTHAWWQALHGSGIYQNGVQIAGLPNYRLKTAFNWSSNDWGTILGLKENQQATDEQAAIVANQMPLIDSAEYTGEISEGGRPQFERPQNVFYSVFAQRLKDANFRGNVYGDYGYNSKNVTLNSSYGRDPLNPYYIKLTGPDAKLSFEQVAGSGHTTFKNGYLDSGQYLDRGTVIGAYYAITHQTPDRTPLMGYEAIVVNNVAPTQPKMRFCAPFMQSNSNGTDVPYKDGGTYMTNGVLHQNFPEMPAEIMKQDSFFSLLYYTGTYLWDAVGVLSKNNPELFYNSSITTDNWIEGTRKYAKLIPYLNQANRDIVCTDFTTSEKRYSFKTPERRISNSGRTYYYNQYFNEVVAGKTGMLLTIPATKKAFIWLNSYKRADDIESVTAHIDGKDYYLGEAAGSTLTIFYEK